MNRLSGRLRQSSRLDGRLPGMLAAEPAAGVGNYHADLVVGQSKRISQLLLHARRLLRSRPNRELAVVPFGNRRPRFHRSVLNVGHRVVGRNFCSIGQPLFPIAPRLAAAASASAAARRLFQMCKKLAVRDVRFLLPCGALGEGFDCLAGLPRCRSRAADKLAVAYHSNVLHRASRLEIDRFERRPERRRTQHAAVQHTRPHNIRRILYRPRHNIPTGHFRRSGPQHTPLLRRREFNAVGGRTGIELGAQILVDSQLCQRQLLALSRDERAVLDLQLRPIPAEPLRSIRCEHLANGSRRVSHARDR